MPILMIQHIPILSCNWYFNVFYSKEFISINIDCVPTYNGEIILRDILPDLVLISVHKLINVYHKNLYNLT